MCCSSALCVCVCARATLTLSLASICLIPAYRTQIHTPCKRTRHSSNHSDPRCHRKGVRAWTCFHLYFPACPPHCSNSALPFVWAHMCCAMRAATPFDHDILAHNPSEGLKQTWPHRHTLLIWASLLFLCLLIFSFFCLAVFRKAPFFPHRFCLLLMWPWVCVRATSPANHLLSWNICLSARLSIISSIFSVTTPLPLLPPWIHLQFHTFAGGECA